MNREQLSPDSKIWIYQSDRLLSPGETEEITKKGAAFVSRWSAHGSQLKAVVEVLYHRFILFMVDENQAKASGCSIDKSVAFIKEIESACAVSLLDRMQVAYKNKDRIDTLALSDFQNLLKSGELNENTVVYNNLVSNKAEFETSWETTVKESWHKVLL